MASSYGWRWRRNEDSVGFRAGLFLAKFVKGRPQPDLHKLDYMKRLQFVCKGLIDSSRNRCINLKADLMGYFVDRLEACLDVFFSEVLKGQ
jgi:hypothetical protein